MPDGRYFTERQLKRRMGRLLAPYWSTGRRTYAGFSDAEFYAPTAEEIGAFLDENSISAHLYEDEVFDCDDYAFVFKGFACLHAREMDGVTSSMCLGIAWASFGWVEDELHAVNWVLLDDGSFLWIEPQDGTTHELGECRGGLTLVVV